MTMQSSSDKLFSMKFDFAAFHSESLFRHGQPIVRAITHSHPETKDRKYIGLKTKCTLPKPAGFNTARYRDYDIHYELKDDGTFWVKEFVAHQILLNSDDAETTNPSQDTADRANLAHALGIETHTETQAVNEQIEGDFWVELNNGAVTGAAIFEPALYVPFKDSVCAPMSQWEAKDTEKKMRELRDAIENENGD